MRNSILLLFDQIFVQIMDLLIRKLFRNFPNFNLHFVFYFHALGGGRRGGEKEGVRRRRRWRWEE